MSATECLYRTPKGTVLRCSCCDRVEVSLGNALLSTDLDGYEEFCQVVESFGAEGGERGSRSCVVRVPGNDLAFVFSRPDIEELRQLLRGARPALVGEALGAVPRTHH